MMHRYEFLKHLISKLCFFFMLYFYVLHLQGQCTLITLVLLCQFNHLFLQLITTH